MTELTPKSPRTTEKFSLKDKSAVSRTRIIRCLGPVQLRSASGCCLDSIDPPRQCIHPPTPPPTPTPTHPHPYVQAEKLKLIAQAKMLCAKQEGTARLSTADEDAVLQRDMPLSCSWPSCSWTPLLKVLEAGLTACLHVPSPEAALSGTYVSCSCRRGSGQPGPHGCQLPGCRAVPIPTVDS